MRTVESRDECVLDHNCAICENSYVDNDVLIYTQLFVRLPRDTEVVLLRLRVEDHPDQLVHK